MGNDFITVVCCPICGSNDSDIIYNGNLKVQDTPQIESENYACTAPSLATYFDIAKCKKCKVAYSLFRPSDKKLEQLYRNIVDDVYLEEEEGRYKTFSLTIKDLNLLCQSRGRLFEFGSYTGIFLDLAQKNDWEVFGIELSNWCRKVAKEKRDLDLFSSQVEIDTLEERYFDSVVMWDVIEHVSRPAEIINEAYRILKPGGILALSTIVLDSLSAKLLRNKYPFFMEMHLIYFTQKTLTHFLECHGFEVIRYKRHKRYVSFAYAMSKFSFSSILQKNHILWRFLKNRYFFSSVGLRDIYARKVR